MRVDQREAVRIARVAGPIVATIGALMFIVGFIQFASFDPSPFGEMPSVVLPFFGMILFGVGATVTRWAYVGPVAKYVAEESAPGIRIAARTVVDEARRVPASRCASCGTENAIDARFCKSCAAPLVRRCAACGGASAADARFCDDCGKPIAA